MSKPKFRPIQPLSVPDIALDRINEQMGVPAMTRPEIIRSVQAASKPAPRPQEKLSCELPTYLMDAMRQEALTRKVSVRHLVITALKGIGLAVEAEDLVPDARRSAHSKSRNPA